MKKTFKSLMALLLTLAMCVSLFAGISVSAEGVTEVIIANEEIGQDISGFCTTPSTEQVKVGSYAYKSTPGQGAAECWMMRGNPGGLNVSAVVENGALRFWVYVEDITTLENWGGSRIQMGAGWDNNVYVWGDWHTQITKNGWNDIILPFASAGKVGTPDATNITWFFIRMNAVNFATTVYFDNIRATTDTAPYVEEEVVSEDVIVVDDEAGQIPDGSGFCAGISTEQVKVGNYAIQSTPGRAGASDYWMLRGNPGGVDISSVVDGGALRFWIYVEDLATVHNWNHNSQIQLGAGWDNNVYVWSHWHTQLVNNGWNEVILPFASAGVVGSGVDTTNITWFFIKNDNPSYPTVVYFDNIRATADCVPEEKDIVMATAEWSTEIMNTGFCAVPSDEQAAVGKYSYKCSPGRPGSSDFFAIRGNFNPTDVSGVTQNGTAGALRFKIYVEDISTMDNWGGSQVQFGSNWWDSDVYIWGDFRGQITKNGWNDIVLPFANTVKIGTPNLSAVTFMLIKTNSVTYATTFYVDDIRVTPGAEARADVSVLNEEIGEGAFIDCNTAISTEQVKVGRYSYKSNPTNAFWVLRSSGSPGGLARAQDISALTNGGTSGALRFWVYVEDVADVASWAGSQVQYGYFWDNNVFVWDFHTQVTKNGWNEIVLPFATAGKVGTPDLTNMHYFFIKLGTACDTVLYIDDIRVTASAANYEDVVLVNDEQNIAPSGTGFCATVSSEQAAFGNNSYKSWGGVPGGSDNWVIRGNLPRAYDLSELSSGGTSGALKFSVYVEDIASKDTWYNEGNKIGMEASLGTETWNNYFVWEFMDQITESGWNEVVLPLSDAVIVGTVSESFVSFFWIRVGNVDCDANVYIDNIRFESRKLGDVNADYSINADDVVSVRKALLGIAEADAYADVNNSGNLDIADLIRLKKDIAA